MIDQETNERYQVLNYEDFDRYYRVREKHTNMRLKAQLKDQIVKR